MINRNNLKENMLYTQSIIWTYKKSFVEPELFHKIRIDANLFIYGNVAVSLQNVTTCIIKAKHILYGIRDWCDTIYQIFIFYAFVAV